MNHRFRLLALSLLASLSLAPLACRTQQAETEDEYPSWPTKVPPGKIDFKRNVRPLLIVNCLECHNNESAAANGNLSLETRQLALTTGNHAPVLIPGDPDNSLLITVLTIDDVHLNAMPPAPDKIHGVRMEILRRWIEEGAEWPEDVPLVHPREIKEW
jgi:hypothetical protein